MLGSISDPIANEPAPAADEPEAEIAEEALQAEITQVDVAEAE